MKKLLFFLMAVSAAAWTLQAAPVPRPFELDSRPARSIRISNQTFAEFQPKADNLEIVLPEPALKTLQFAADELKKFLDKRLQTSIPIRKTPSGGKYAIVLGRCELARKAGIDDSVLCRDAFIIRTVGKNIYILGRDTDENIPQEMFSEKVKKDSFLIRLSSERGTLFGVYDFLERFAGIRFYFPFDDFTVIPEGKMTMPEVNIFDRPDFEARHYSYFAGVLHDGADQEARKYSRRPANRFADREKVYHYLRTRMESFTPPFIHGLWYHYIPARFSKTHPEYSALLNPKGSLTDPRNRSGKYLCLSNPGLQEVVKQDIRDYFKGEKKLAGKYKWNSEAFGKGGVNLAMPDALTPCRCSECRPHFTSLQRSSDHIWKFTADIARMLQQEKIPGYVTQLAYHLYRLPPSDSVPLPDNLWVRICVGGPWDIWTPDYLKAQTRLIQDWYKKTNRKNTLWNYSLKYGALNIPDVPNPTPRAFAQYYKQMSPYVNGVFNETITDNYFWNFMTYYMFGRIAWDNSADADQILSEHYRLLYGKGADFMQKFFDELETLWLRKVYQVKPSNSMGPVFSAPSRYDLWFKIYSPEKMKELREYLEKARQAESGNPLILRRIARIKRNFYDPPERAGNSFRQMFKQLGDMTFRVVSLGDGESISPDGNGNEAVWKRCTPIYAQGFTLPADRKNDPMEVRAAADPENLYLLFQCPEPEIKTMKEYSGGDSQQVEIFLQSSNSPKSVCLQLIINTKGEIMPLYRRRYQKKNSIQKLNAIPGVQAAVKKHADFWTAEVKIPLKAVPDFDGNDLYGNFCRQQRGEGRTRYLYSWAASEYFFVPDRFGAVVLPKNFSGKPVHNVDYNTVAPWQENPRIQAEDGVLTVQKNTPLFGPQFEVDPQKNYTLSLQCSAGNLPEGKETLVLAGFQAFDREGREISAIHVNPVSEVLTLAKDVRSGDITVQIQGNFSRWKASPVFSMVYGAAKDLSDLPNRNIFGSGIQKAEKENDCWLITFRKPVKTALKAGTPVRVHRASGDYLYSAGCKKVGTGWILLKGHIKGVSKSGWNQNRWPAATAKARVVILSNWNRQAEFVRFKEISFTEK